jgi:putative toxin-antitoxin system antitoxin component (TIGR02293 family)
MAKHTKKSRQYTQEEKPANTVAEPILAYAYPQDPVAARTILLMGMQGKKDFTQIRNENDFIGVIRTGIPKLAMNHLMDVADITLAEMAAIIHTSDRNLRRYTDNEKLPQDQSERLVELARLYRRGEDVFGTMAEFRIWMDTVLLPFGNKKPKEFLDTSLGIGMIMNELGRLEHGILA